MPKLNENLVDKIAENCLNSFLDLPKTGKPIKDEWTVLSCMVQYNIITGTAEVVSLGTGSKCIGATKMSSQGNILNDSHAEVIARRSFLLYLYEQIKNANDNQTSIFIKEMHTFKLKDNIEFIFYSSQLPCGDASIITKTGDSSEIGDLLNRKRLAENDIGDVESKRYKQDIHRTGAKCLSNNKQDSKEIGCNYHLVGQVRTKPGRGDCTLSVSCSDKMAKWIHVGVQGSLLSLLLSEPILIKHFIFGSGVPYSEDALNRAFLQRESEVSINDRLNEIPEFYRSSLKFPHLKTQENNRPAAGSIIWVKTKNSLLEVAVQGKKLGVTKKDAKNLTNLLSICKYNLYKTFIEILHESRELKEHICGDDILENICYNDMKQKAVQYQACWSNIKEIFFKSWTSKPDMWDFSVNKMM